MLASTLGLRDGESSDPRCMYDSYLTNLFTTRMEMPSYPRRSIALARSQPSSPHDAFIAQLNAILATALGMVTLLHASHRYRIKEV